MNVILIQPPDPQEPVEPVKSASFDTALFSPPWNLMCLRAYLVERTRHACHFLDCRFHTRLESDFVEAVGGIPAPRILVINASILALGQTMAVLEIAKRHFPEIKTVLCGELPCSFPELTSGLSRMDFALAGDPEPILRNLLDYMDVEPRLMRIPGLIIPRKKQSPGYWMPDLKSLTLPEWDGVLWSAYQTEGPRPVCRGEMRLSRGHTQCPSDRAFGSDNEPFRIWPVERAALSMLKCAHLGVTEVFLNDPPGVWTPERLSQWCVALKNVRNSQPWALRLLPTFLDEATVSDMESTICKRIEFLFPSCDSDVLKSYGCVIAPEHLGAMSRLLKGYNIDVFARFWVGGPEEPPDEDLRIRHTIKALGYCKYILEPFPLVFDAPIYRLCADTSPTPQIAEWIQWSLDPWQEQRPVPLWGGKDGLLNDSTLMADVHSAILRSWGRVFKGLLRHIFATNWVHAAEKRATGFFPAIHAIKGKTLPRS